jgi:hypothetical protein
MQDQPIQGRSDSGGCSPTFAEDIRDQSVVLTHILVLHPTHLKLPDLAREITAGSKDAAEGDRIERAVRDLTGIGLLYCADGLVLPTHAAIRFEELLGGLS